MDRKEAQIKIEGATDFVRLFVATMENMGTIAGTPLRKEDYDRLVELMKGVREVLVKRYQKEITFEEGMR